MQFANKVAVITGAGSGIGRGLAETAGTLGMRVVLADITATGLDETARLLTSRGVPNTRRITDVADYASVEALADHAFATYGNVHMLFNNAGVLVDGVLWERSLDEWRWMLDVNVMGVVHGIKAFLPRMIENDEEGMVVNTASIGGLISPPFMGPYTTSKQAVVCVTETLHYELTTMGKKIRAAVLCPGGIATGIARSLQTNPAAKTMKTAELSPSEAAFHDAMSTVIAQGTPPVEFARFVFDELTKGKFWVLPHGHYMNTITGRYNSIMTGEAPPIDPRPVR